MWIGREMSKMPYLTILKKWNPDGAHFRGSIENSEHAPFKVSSLSSAG